MATKENNNVSPLAGAGVLAVVTGLISAGEHLPVQSALNMVIAGAFVGAVTTAFVNALPSKK